MTGLKTVAELQPLVDRKVLVRFESQQREAEDFLVLCKILDVASSFGRVRIRVTPISGSGSQWVDHTRLRLDDPKTFAKNDKRSA